MANVRSYIDLSGRLEKRQALLTLADEVIE
jgi:hypothetical protein